MHRDIIISAFAKAKKEEYEETGLEGSTNRASERISAFISSVSDIPYSSRSLRNAFNDSSDSSKPVEILQPQVLNALCIYLDYENYQEYVQENNGEKSTSNDSKDSESQGVHVPKAHYFKWIAFLALFVTIGLGVYFFSERQRWMEWNEDHYLEVSFDAKKLKEGSLKLFDEDRIENFRKVTLTCDSVFFNTDASPRFWYGKNRKKELEFYTDLAKHPETGKALKPLSKYMIDKYVCDM